MLRQYSKHRTSKVEKLRLERASMIRALMDDGYSQSDIATKMGISRQAVNQILNRHKVAARHKLNYAIKKGYKGKPKLCMDCNLEKSLQAHHEDYGLPLDVRWLCKDCHSIIEDRSYNVLTKNPAFSKTMTDIRWKFKD